MDTVAALVPKAELEGEMGDQSGPNHAGCRKPLHGLRLRFFAPVPGHLHQPVAGEDRHYSRKSGNDTGRPGAEVLVLGPHRHPPHPGDQAGRGRRSATATARVVKMCRPAVPAGRVRHPLRQGHQQRGRPGGPGGRAGRDRAPGCSGSASMTSVWARAGTTSRSSSRRTRSSPPGSRKRSEPRSGSPLPKPAPSPRPNQEDKPEPKSRAR